MPHNPARLGDARQKLADAQLTLEVLEKEAMDRAKARAWHRSEEGACNVGDHLLLLPSCPDLHHCLLLSSCPDFHRHLVLSSRPDFHHLPSCPDLLHSSCDSPVILA